MCERLADLWVRETGRAPTTIWDDLKGERRGSFLDLCRDAIGHVCEVLNVAKPDLKGVVGQLIKARHALRNNGEGQ